MSQPAWLAETGIPLLLTLGGLVVAYAFLKRQLNSDNTIFTHEQNTARAQFDQQQGMARAQFEAEQRAAREHFEAQQQTAREQFVRQLESDRELRRADHNREAARALGHVLKKAASNLEKLNAPELNWHDARWTDRSPIEEAIADAAIQLNNIELSRISNLCEAISDMWMACCQRGRRENPELNRHISSVRKNIQPYAQCLDSVGASLLGWDGTGEMPRASSADPAVATALDGVDREQRQARIAAAREAYVSGLSRLLLTKTSGVEFNDFVPVHSSPRTKKLHGHVGTGGDDENQGWSANE